LNEEDLTAIWNYMHETRTLGTVALDCLEIEGKETYEKLCSRCHALPEPAKPNCLSETPLAELIKAHSFMESVREGKDLYGKSCNSCHASIEPSKHSFDFWRRHLCAEDAGLEMDEAQKVLLYLKAAGNRQ
jgi:cytochrome c5